MQACDFQRRFPVAFPSHTPGFHLVIRLRVRWRLWDGPLGQLLAQIFWLLRPLLRTAGGSLGQVASDTLQQMFPPREAGADTHFTIHTHTCAHLTHSHARRDTNVLCSSYQQR